MAEVETTGRLREMRGRVAVVTGGASGIGKGLCQALLAEGRVPERSSM